WGVSIRTTRTTSQRESWRPESSPFDRTKTNDRTGSDADSEHHDDQNERSTPRGSVVGEGRRNGEPEDAERQGVDGLVQTRKEVGRGERGHDNRCGLGADPRDSQASASDDLAGAG